MGWRFSAVKVLAGFWHSAFFAFTVERGWFVAAGRGMTPEVSAPYAISRKDLTHIWLPRWSVGARPGNSFLEVA
jgi:hypothetical protein